MVVCSYVLFKSVEFFIFNLKRYKSLPFYLFCASFGPCRTFWYFSLVFTFIMKPGALKYYELFELRSVLLLGPRKSLLLLSFSPLGCFWNELCLWLLCTASAEIGMHMIIKIIISFIWFNRLGVITITFCCSRSFNCRYAFTFHLPSLLCKYALRKSHLRKHSNLMAIPTWIKLKTPNTYEVKVQRRIHHDARY